VYLDYAFFLSYFEFMNRFVEGVGKNISASIKEYTPKEAKFLFRLQRIKQQ